jgi:hypothetical protein
MIEDVLNVFKALEDTFEPDFCKPQWIMAERLKSIFSENLFLARLIEYATFIL